MQLQLVHQVLDEKYRIEKLLGKGGMGAVYLATHIGTARPVALKVIAPQFMTHPESVERFKREAMATGLLRHPNIVDVTDFGFAHFDSQRIAYLVMEYLDGVALSDVLKEEKKLPLTWVVNILEQVCVAIDRAHQRGIVHRDLKPDNIWLVPNDLGGFTPKILDFGLARLAFDDLSDDKTHDASLESTIIDNIDSKLDKTLRQQTTTHHQNTGVDSTQRLENSNKHQINHSEKLSAPINQSSGNNVIDSAAKLQNITQVGVILGTPYYMSPEQCLGQSVNKCSDIYSLGIIAYEMLAGERPFSGKSSQELIQKHTQEPPPPIAEKRSDIPKSVQTLIESALEKDPSKRPQSAVAFSSALNARSKGAASLIRQAFILYSEHTKVFLTISLIAFIPYAIVELIGGLGLDNSFSSTVVNDLWALSCIILLIFTWIFAFAVSTGLITPIIAQSVITPLRPLEFSSALEVLKKRMRPFISASLRYYWSIIPGLTALFLICIAIFVFVSRSTSTPEELATETAPDRESLAYKIGASLKHLSNDSTAGYYLVRFFLFAILISLLIAMLFLIIRAVKSAFVYILYPPLVIMENISGKESLKRSKELVGRIKFAVFIALVVNFFVIVIEELPSTLIDSFAEVDERGFYLIFAKFIANCFSILITILLTPLITIMLALLYFKARQTNGETLKEILNQYESSFLLPTNWQLSLHDTISKQIRSIR